MRHPGSGDSSRFAVYEIVHDRNVVRRQIPDDIDIVLKQAKVDAHGIEIVQFSKIAVVDEPFYGLDRTGVDESMVHHDLQPLLFGQVDEALGLFHGGRERFLHEQVLAVGQHLHAKRIMSRNRCGDDNGIDVGRLQDVVGIIGQPTYGRELPTDEIQTLRSRIADSRHLHIVKGVEVPDQIRSPVAAADYANFHR